MQLIGMLDSPFVRRVAISLQLLKLPFSHRSVSVFSAFDVFRAINPVVKSPSLICDDGTVLMDSSLILDYAETLAHPRSLMPKTINERQQVLRIIGLAMAANEKSVQLYYESQRPADKQYDHWQQRVYGQLTAAYDQLEQILATTPLAVDRTITQAGVTVAVAWYFTQHIIPGTIDPKHYPQLVGFSHLAEQLPEFMAAPYGDSEYQAGYLY